ncbi:Endo-1,4-beta-xylanase B precursor [Lunatimonas lonarensis]|uniref:Endo-1,4-beta-xylanase B n=1 Tax=Lunatimonas lonarensis TaxID=1232681 RepID=R7ZMF3_9BACT|nr:alpha/beta hydrolase [Lunatimonas lonarensis]EON75281.1 Endo-1,4-beta-xylanase B precursor [Lunatimonas lonarensis]
MKKLILLLFVSLQMTAVSAQFDPVLVPLYDGDIPYRKASDQQEEVQVSDIMVVRKVQEPTLQVFLPAKRNATGQAVIICPGGGYGVLAYDWEGLDIAKWLNGHGIVGIVLKYRLPSAENQTEPHLVPLSDAQRAMRLVRSRAAEWHIDPGKIGIMGFSAGGHLASSLATHFDGGDPSASDVVEKFSCRPDFAILAYPVISFDPAYTHIGSRNNLIGQQPDSKWVEYFSNEKQVTSETPPSFLFHSQDDTVVPISHSIRFYEALTLHQVPAEMHLYPTGGHGFSLSVTKEGTQKGWMESCVQWLGALP